MKRSSVLVVLSLSLALSPLLFVTPARADTAADLQQQIADKNAQLQALQKEIAEYEAQLSTIGSARKTLEAEIQRLDTSRKKLSADISATKNKIAIANLTLEELAGEIADKDKRIQNSKSAIEQSLRIIGHLDEITMAEHFLSGEALALAWEDADRLGEVQSALGSEIENLSTTRAALQDNQTAVAKEQQNLQSYTKQLTGQKVVLDQNRVAQATVLTETKSKESNYQTLLNQKKAAADALQNEINSYEAGLQYNFDPTQIPAIGSGVLAFPIDPVVMARCPGKQSALKNVYCITQYFGNTPFAQSGAYNGAGHNGIDIGIPEGTKILAARAGVVVGIGNTDLIRGCYSFGKWVMVRHDDGLSTLYAHLSYVAVSGGQSVGLGEFLGLSGQTGYATGPHLHFGVYVSDAVRIIRLGDIKSITKCANAVVPVAPTAAYLNPVNYL